MRKFTKEISVLLSVVSAGTIGGTVFATTDEGYSSAGTSGDITASQTEEGLYMGKEAPPDDYLDDTLTMGDAPLYTTVTTTTNIPMPIGTAAPSTKYTEPVTTVTTPIFTTNTPMPIGTAAPSTKYTEPVTIVTTPIFTTSTPMPIGTAAPSGEYTEPVTEPDPYNQTPNAIRGRGDINGDGVTDLSDLIRLSQYLLHDIALEEDELIEADMTIDGQVDITDLPAMKMKIMTPDNTDPGLDITNPEITTPITAVPDTQVSEITTGTIQLITIHET